jgi:hypothetical protein
MFPSRQEGSFKEDGPSSIVAAPAVVQVDLAADRDTHPEHKTAQAVLAGLCTPRGLSLAALLDPADGLDSAPHGPVSVLALDLVHHGLEPVAPVA